MMEEEKRPAAEEYHRPVLLEQCLEGLKIRPDGIYVDGTAGGGGHSEAIAKRLTTGKLYSLDQDPDAIRQAGQRLAAYPQAKVLQTNFADMVSVLANEGVTQVDGVLLDLGVSSHQLDEGQRGFSYRTDAPLDMRMSQTGLSAADVVNTYDRDSLVRIFWEYGEEKFSRRVADAIVAQREKKPIETTFELAELIKGAYPAAARRSKNPCKKVFQAIRIEVNRELDVLAQGLEAAFSLLKPGGRLAVITFHSLEDRLVKNTFADYCTGCICPPEFPQCVCGRKPRAKKVTRKPITATETELAENHRSHSAKLRVLEKLDTPPGEER